MSNDVTVKLKGDRSDLDRALDGSRQSVMGYANAVKAALAGIAAAVAVREVLSFSRTLLDLYQEQEHAERKLESVIRATGGAAGYSAEQMKAMASELQNYLGIGDEVILSNQAILATFTNIRGDTFREAIVAAADMAEILGGDLTSKVNQLGKALNDPTVGMSALAESGVSFTQQQKDMIRTLQESGDMLGAQRIILDELAKEFGGAAHDNAMSFEGQMTSLWNRLGDVGEVLGGYLIPVLEAFVPVVDLGIRMIENLSSALGVTEESSKAFSDSWGKFFVDLMKESAYITADVFSLLEFVFTNFGAIVERQTYAWTLSFVRVWEELKYGFTEVVPAYLGWFADNWFNIWKDVQNFQMTVLINMAKNVTEFFTSLLDWLSGGKGSFEFTALTDGFEASTSKLPEIAARQKSDMEIYLSESIKQMDNALGQSFSDTFNRNKKFVDDLFADKPKVDVDMTANFEPFKKELKDSEDEIAKTKIDSTNKVQAAEKRAQESNNAGSSVALEALAGSIQEATIKNSLNKVQESDVENRSFVFEGPGKAVLDEKDDKKIEVNQEKVVGEVGKADQNEAQRHKELMDLLNKRLKMGLA